MIGYQDTQPITCGQAAGGQDLHQPQGGQEQGQGPGAGADDLRAGPVICSLSVTNCQRLTAAACGAALFWGSITQKYKNTQQQQEGQQAMSYTINTRGHKPRRTEEPPPQVTQI